MPVIKLLTGVSQQPAESALQTVDYGRQTILFTLRFAERKTLGISVYPDRSVQVTAPYHTPLDKIKVAVRKRGSWIMKQQRQLASLPPPLPPRQYQSGESFRYLGRQHRLKVEQAETANVKLLQGRLWVFTPEPDKHRKTQSLIQDWYRNRARLVFTERLERCSSQAARYDIPGPKAWRLMRMSKRWGSCSKDGQIILNPDLVAAPKDCIDYVITHELCHLLVHNHSKAYFELLERVMPDWEGRKNKLNKTVEARLV